MDNRAAGSRSDRRPAAAATVVGAVLAALLLGVAGYLALQQAWAGAPADPGWRVQVANYLVIGFALLAGVLNRAGRERLGALALVLAAAALVWNVASRMPL